MPSPVHIVLFRGVGGATQLPVKPLREKLREAGFAGVATYINSGNAVVAGGGSKSEIHETVTRICRTHFGFEKAVHVLSRAQWNRLIANNPFPEGTEPGKFLHAAVLERVPKADKVAALTELAAAAGEGFAVVGKVAYLHTPGGFGTSRLAERFDRGIGVGNTARNWNTVRKLAELAEDLAKGSS